MIKSNQTIEDWSDCSTEHTGWSDNSVEDYMAVKGDLQRVEGLINDGALSPQFGTGSPEGVVIANYSLKYIDTSVPTEYYNPTFGSDTGWVAL
jgi:hypothetical protein